jgi:hypothetical protein
MRLRFTEEHVQNVPAQPGIFCLWYGRDLVYVGCTMPRSDLRTELEHALTMAMADDMLTTTFSYEVTRMPQSRAADELRSYFSESGGLPKYNEPAGRLSRGEGQVLRAR